MPVNTISHNDYHQTDKPRRRTYSPRHRCLEPVLDGLQPGKAVAVDCEGVELLSENGKIKSGKEKKGLGRISVVDEVGKVRYDTIVCYPEEINWKIPAPWKKLGVKYPDLRPENGAQPLAKVLKDVKTIFDISALVVGHGFENEEDYLRGIDFSNYEIRDTQRAAEYQQYAKSTIQGPALKDLSEILLNTPIQQESHSSIVDARATMRLYLRERQSIDAAQARSAANSSSSTSSGITSSVSTSDGSTTAGTTSFGATSDISASNAASWASIAANSAVSVSTTMSATPAMFPTVQVAPSQYENAIALPYIARNANGRTWDKRTSRFY